MSYLGDPTRVAAQAAAALAGGRPVRLLAVSRAYKNLVRALARALLEVGIPVRLTVGSARVPPVVSEYAAAKRAPEVAAFRPAKGAPHMSEVVIAPAGGESGLIPPKGVEAEVIAVSARSDAKQTAAILTKVLAKGRAVKAVAIGPAVNVLLVAALFASGAIRVPLLLRAAAFPAVQWRLERECGVAVYFEALVEPAEGVGEAAKRAADAALPGPFSVGAGVKKQAAGCAGGPVG
ncbi:MAG: hypothetical protein AB1716_20430 [Planctomycetota bacterium]